MNKHVLIVFALGVVLAGCHRGDRAAEKILQNNAAARGGLDAWRKVQTMSMTGTVEAGVARDPLALSRAYLRAATDTRARARQALQQAPDPTRAKQVKLPFVLELQRGRRSRLELSFQGDTALQIFDGARGWKVRPFLGRKELEPYTSEELRLASQQADLDGPLLDAAAKGSKVELLTTEPVEGHPAYKLKVTNAEGQSRLVWVDTQSALELKVDGTRWMDGKPRAVSTFFRDYRLVGGLLIAHTLETSVEGVIGTERISIEHVTLNPELAAARFARPELARSAP